MSLAAPVVLADANRFKPAHLDFEQGLQWQLGKAVFDKLWQPVWSVSNPQHGALDKNTQLSPRLATPLIGTGWLELITDADLIALSDPNDINHDGISGRPNRIGVNKALGRFGWKAGQATLVDQALLALNHDIGISNVLLPHAQGDCTIRQPECLKRMEADDAPEASAEMTGALMFFLQQLPVPAAPTLNADDIAGQQLFQTLQCSTCHHPEFTLNQKGKEIRIAPYSDLLLHDMGEALSDGLREHAASGQEWRTPPLWGIGQQLKLVKRTAFMHDGRARSLHEAILHHAGEADASRIRYQHLAPQQRAQLIRYLESL